MTKTLNLMLSIVSLVFIIVLVSISHIKYDVAHSFLGAVLELLTIPIIIMTIALLVVNVIKWSKEKWSFKTSTFYALSALILSVGIMIIATMYNI